MSGKIEERRKALREKLVDIAEDRMIDGGIGAVKARDLAKQADCALGAIYTVFDDLTEITLAVNGRTFRRLGAAVAQDLEGQVTHRPTDRLIAIATAYLDFAMDHSNLWHALFEVEFSPDLEVPEWYWAELDALYAHISEPVQECFPELSAEDLALMTRALFSAVHGIVLRGLENRAAPVPRDDIIRMITLLLTHSTGNR